MRRILIFLIVVALLIAASTWLAERPGAVTIRWQAWRIDTSVPVLLLALLAVVALLYGGFRVIGALFEIPGQISAGRRLKRQRKGYLALTDGLAAVAAGDAARARRSADKANQLLSDPPLTLLLSAQAAQLAGNRDDARANFTAMLDRPETAFLGLRGLLTQALKDGDSEAALQYARRAYAINPEAGWLASTLFDLLARAGHWPEAIEVLDKSVKRGALPADEIRRKRAVALHERAGELSAQGQPREALKLARQAHEIDRAFPAAAIRYAELLLRDGKDKKAAAALEDSWRIEPHPDLAAAHLDLGGDADPLSRVRRAERLAAAHPDHRESHLAVAEAALAAQLWGQARTHLLAAADIQPSARVYRLLARLEDGEKADAQAARDWLGKLADAPPDPVWHCQHCGGDAAQWSALCPRCGGFDSLAWTTPSGGRTVQLGKAAAS